MRTRSLMLGCVLALGFVLVGWALGWVEVEGSPEPTRSADAVGILVAPPPSAGMLQTVGCAPESLTGTLRADPATGLAIDDSVIVWPHGYGAREEAGATFLVDERGRDVARIGDTVSINVSIADEQGRWWPCGEIRVEPSATP